VFCLFEREIQMFIGNENIDLRLVLIDSAQSFSWCEVRGAFYGAAGGHAIKLWQNEEGIFAEGAEAAFIRDYLDLNRDYKAVASEFSHVECAMRAMQLYPGMRVLNQDAWEMIITFILSANNNVARIKTLVDELSRLLGERYVIDGVELYTIPDAQSLASADEAALRGIGVGYRAPYLIKTARMVEDGFPLAELPNMDYETAHKLLVSLPGVGDKVADCVQLFGCRHSCAFPVDVWVERLLKSWFGLEKCSKKRMPTAARELLGENCGLMQQFLFHAARTGDMEL